jgi:hypothetical protein
MKNFILFIVVASCLAVAGYFAYQVYYLGEAPRDVWASMTGQGGSAGPSYLEQAERAWQEERWADAAKHYESAKAAYLANDPDNPLYTDDDVEHVYIRIGQSWAKAYEASGETDKAAAKRAAEAIRVYLDDERWKKSSSRKSAMRTLRDVQ